MKGEKPVKILVTGGAGYIGSHTCVELLHSGHRVIIADNLSNASYQAVMNIAEITGVSPAFYQLDVCDREALRELFRTERPEAVIHFAGFKAVGESCAKPLKYYRNNLDSTLSLLETMDEFGCRMLVFSSSATVYGEENSVPFDENMPALTSSNPYGRTKVMIERIIRDYAATATDFRAVLLRYFNPIGAHPSGLLGDDPNGIPNNLMPYVVRVAEGRLPLLTVFGDDYDTPDGTCLRDFLHVVDLAKGHLSALGYCAEHTGVEAVNLGTGRGTSVLELVHAFERANDLTLPYVIGPRRDGDLDRCWADPSKAQTLLGWRAELSLEQMCRDSWHFVRK